MNRVVITTEGEPGVSRLGHFMAQWGRLVDGGITIHRSGVRKNPHEGCWEAHRLAMMLETGPTVIFEDDACFRDDFTLDVQFPDDWDLFYFGGQHMRQPLPWGGNIVRCVRMHATHAYAIRDPFGLAKLIGHGHAAGPNHDISHRLQRVVRDNHLRAYALSPFTVGQSASQSVIASNYTRTEDDYFDRDPDYWKNAT